MKRSAYFSLALLLVVAVWMLSGVVTDAPASQMPADPTPPSVSPMKVRVISSVSAEVTREIVTQGQLEPLRRVEIRAETAGRVTEVPVPRGSRVDEGTVLVVLAEEDRRAQIARAEAEIASQQLVVEGTRKLQKRGLQAANQLKAAEAALAAADAERERLELDLAWTRILAPFEGTLETRAVERGSLLERGDKVAELVDDSVLKAAGNVPQQTAGALAMGQAVSVRLLDGREANGRITYIARVAETGTRSFRIEAEVANPDRQLNGGVSAELRVDVGLETAHFLSPAALTLDGAGRVGVMSVNDSDQVEFHPVTLVRTDVDGVWVSGLPERLRVITRGQGFLATGETVEPVLGS